MKNSIRSVCRDRRLLQTIHTLPCSSAFCDVTQCSTQLVVSQWPAVSFVFFDTVIPLLVLHNSPSDRIVDSQASRCLDKNIGMRFWECTDVHLVSRVTAPIWIWLSSPSWRRSAPSVYFYTCTLCFPFLFIILLLCVFIDVSMRINPCLVPE